MGEDKGPDTCGTMYQFAAVQAFTYLYSIWLDNWQSHYHEQEPQPTSQTAILQDYTTWHHKLEANGCTPENHRIPGLGSICWGAGFPVPNPSQGKLRGICGITFRCSGLYKIRAWNPARKETARPPWAPAPLPGCPHEEKTFQNNSSSFKDFQNISMIGKHSWQQKTKISPSLTKQIGEQQKSVKQINNFICVC